MDETITYTETQREVRCISCENDIGLDAVYCFACGQKVISHRLSTKVVLKDVISSITNIESGFWYSLKMLIVKPHEYLADYLDGATKRYTNVFRLIFLLSAVNFFINGYTGLMDGQMKISSTAGDSEMTANIIELVQKYMMYLFFLMIPFFALASYWVFRKRKLYYAEHLVLNATWLSGTTLLGFVIYLFVPIFGVEHVMFYAASSMIIFLGYFIYANKMFFNTSWVRSIILSFLHLVIGYIMFSLLIGIVGVVVGVTMKLFLE